ncbi:MAG: hypothetical protein ACYS1A_18395 [Planctomycetota bacterium]|jgi:hypothetical protein
MADQHNDNIPAVGNQIANDIPDIKENLEYHLDLFQNFCGTVSKTDATGVYPGSWGRTAISSDDTLDDTHYWVDVDTSGADVTLTLPVAATAGSDRYYIIKLNDATNQCIIDGDTAETIDGEAIVTLTQADETIMIICDGSNWNILFHYAPKAASGKALPLPRSYLAGLTLSNDTDADHDINITAGECRDSTNAYNIVLPSEITKQIDATWAAGNDAGGMEAADAVGNTEWFHVHLLYSPSTGVVDAGFDTSVTATNLLADAAVVTAGHTIYRRIGAVLTDGTANILAFTQVGDEFIWSDPPLDINLTNIAAETTASQTLSAPLGVKTEAIINAVVSRGGSNSARTYLRSPDASNEAASDSAAPLKTLGNSDGTINAVSNIQIKTGTSSEIYSISKASAGANTTLRIVTLGYKDRRGKDD